MNISWNLDLANVVLILVTVAGWYVIFFLNNRQRKEDLLMESKYEVYKMLWSYHDKVSDLGGKFATQCLSGAPFIRMDSTMKTAKVLFPAVEAVNKGNVQAMNLFNDYRNELIGLSQAYKGSFIQFWKELERWMHVMPDLQVALRILISEYQIVSDAHQELIATLQGLNDWNWQEWNREQLKKDFDALWHRQNIVLFYSEDFMRLVHNELISPLFRYEMNLRLPQDSRYKVLTKSGLVVRSNNG